MARVSDLRGIRQIIQPLEMAGTLVRRTDEEVCIPVPASILSSFLHVLLPLYVLPSFWVLVDLLYFTRV